MIRLDEPIGDLEVTAQMPQAQLEELLALKALVRLPPQPVPEPEPGRFDVLSVQADQPRGRLLRVAGLTASLGLSLLAQACEHRPAMPTPSERTASHAVPDRVEHPDAQPPGSDRPQCPERDVLLDKVRTMLLEGGCLPPKPGPGSIRVFRGVVRNNQLTGNVAVEPIAPLLPQLRNIPWQQAAEPVFVTVDIPACDMRQSELLDLYSVLSSSVEVPHV